MPPSISELLQNGIEHQQSGRLQDAEAVYQTILREQPQNADALHLLGVVALQVGNNEAAVELIEKAIAARPEEPQFYNMCGEAYRAMQQFDTAIARFEQALAINPDFAGAHNNLGNAHQESGRPNDAISCYQKAISISPDFAMSHNNLGVIFKDLGRSEDAIAHFQQALAAMPGYAEAHSNMGNILLELGRPREAHAHHQQAVEMMPGNPVAHCNLGTTLDEMGRPQDAIDEYEQALSIDQNYAEAHHNLGNALDEMGRRTDAISHYRRAIAVKPGYAEAHRNLSRVDPDTTQASAIETLLHNPALNDADAIHCHFALGNIYHHTKNFDTAFTHFSKGNSRKRETVDYQSSHFTAHVDRLIAVFTKEYFLNTPARGSESDIPVFILGMPRSGTSLIEQIVSSHPQVHGAGELTAIARIERSLNEQFGPDNPYPDCLARCPEATLADFAKRYIEELRGHSQSATRITDKMPDNFMRIGLIKTLFPKARIIHCRRGALDTCTSNYLNYFATGNDYSFDQEELGRFYLDYERLMKHWGAVLSADILDVHYEELVTQQEDISRQIIEYIALAWDDRCLEFHKNERAVHVFSSMQVRQPIYSRSVNRWQQYEKQLAPLRAVLGPEPDQSL